MKKFVIATLALVAFAAPVFAADMPVKATAVQSYNWSGLYLGLDGGWQRQSHTWAYDPPIGGAANQSWSESSRGGVLGVHGGAQMQWGQIVLGAEYALNVPWSDRAWDSHVCPNAALNCQTGIGRINTVGGRLGYAGQSEMFFARDWLLYATGGAAWGDVQTRVTFISTGAPTGEVSGKTQQGWYAGFGVETVLYKGTLVDLIGGLEYQHVDLGTSFQCTLATCGVVSTLNRDVGAKADTVRLRLTFKSKGLPFFGSN